MEYLRASHSQELPESGPVKDTRPSGGSEPTHPGDPAVGYAALRQGVAVVDHSQKKILRLTGKDPFGLLDAVLTNRMPKEEHLGVYAALLNQKGRIQTDLRVLKDGDGILIDTEPEGAAAAKEILGRYAPFSRVKVEDLSEEEPPWEVLGLYGPRAGEFLENLALAEHETAEIKIAGTSLLAAGVAVPVSGYDLIGPADSIESAWKKLMAMGAIPAVHDAFETARIEAGVPRFGSDMTPENFPGETGILERAVSFAKGCYPGQETVARMHYRGHPNRNLHRFVIDGPSPGSGAEIFQGEKKVGWISSVAPLPVEAKRLGLGYLSRKADTEIRLNSGEARVSLAQDTKD